MVCGVGYIHACVCVCFCVAVNVCVYLYSPQSTTNHARSTLLINLNKYRLASVCAGARVLSI